MMSKSAIKRTISTFLIRKTSKNIKKCNKTHYLLVLFKMLRIFTQKEQYNAL
jgi:hypothetical protein